MNSKSLLLLGCMAFGLAACGSDPAADVAGTGAASPFGVQSSATIIPVDPGSSNSGVVPPPTNGTVLPLASTANKAAPVSLYDVWKSFHYVTMEDESTYYTSIASGYNYVFLPEFLPAARVVWSTQSTGMYAAHCKVDDSAVSAKKFRGCTVSEGIGYGMLITAFQGNEPDFIRLWNYSRAFRKYNNLSLTPWITYSFHFNEIDNSSATDADLDIATSLIIMYMNTGNAAYLNDALVIAGAIWDKEVNKSNYYLYAGDTHMWTGGTPIVYNLSYFSPVALRLFAKFDTAHPWNFVLDAMYTYMTTIQNLGTGVFPDWSTDNSSVNPPNDAAGNEKSGFTYYTFNKESVRIPWRIAWDYYWFQDTRAGAILKKLNDFIVAKSGGDPSSNALATNYSWNLSLGADVSKNTSVPSQWYAAWCATGLGTNSAWLDKCTTGLNAIVPTNNGSSYFSDILLLMYSQLLNGMYVKPAALGM